MEDTTEELELASEDTVAVNVLKQSDVLQLLAIDGRNGVDGVNVQKPAIQEYGVELGKCEMCPLTTLKQLMHIF